MSKLGIPIARRKWVAIVIRISSCQLSTYANQAKVVVTSRIHVGLPAAALGIPVIFVEGGPERSNWLPGGKQAVGRVEGLLDVFHRVQRGVDGKNWTFGDLTGDVPHSDGVHLADWYRASFLE